MESQENVVCILHSYLSTRSCSKLQKQALVATMQWIQFGLAIKFLTQLIETCLLLLENSETFDMTIEMLTMLMSDKNIKAHEQTFYNGFLTCLTQGPIGLAIDMFVGVYL